MEKFKEHTGNTFPLDRSNVDTDQIIPKQFLKRIERTGFGEFLFFHWRFDEEGSLRDDFSLNDPEYSDASILIGGDNFGCGSSREHAPWSLGDFGFKVIIAPSFADIFYNNCVKNGILPVVLAEKEMDQLMEKAANPPYKLTVDLENQHVTDGDSFSASFTIDEHWKNMLLNGWDEIGLTLRMEEQIKEYERKHLLKG
ncbi:3-isopropylmalate dehydratase small subunit [Bacillus marinisedimentorum]|uniref:3-isopropylmalate dehydratase small subunit n=1 Tax=Bacillus marinisedimentorum TaxID=1821260 RepID=UPI0007DEA7C3|nr:3-isopropylmalate dehydratase small subunit [Bacillus marinisedimentorum]